MAYIIDNQCAIDQFKSMSCGMWHVACGMWHVACGNVACIIDNPWHMEYAKRNKNMKDTKGGRP